MVLINSDELLKMVNEALEASMTKNGIPDTKENRIDTLTGMHRIIAREGIHLQNDRRILQTIEDEIIRLTDLSL